MIGSKPIPAPFAQGLSAMASSSWHWVSVAFDALVKSQTMSQTEERGGRHTDKWMRSNKNARQSQTGAGWDGEDQRCTNAQPFMALTICLMTSCSWDPWTVLLTRWLLLQQVNWWTWWVDSQSQAWRMEVTSWNVWLPWVCHEACNKSCDLWCHC